MATWQRLIASLQRVASNKRSSVVRASHMHYTVSTLLPFSMLSERFAAFVFLILFFSCEAVVNRRATHLSQRSSPSEKEKEVQCQCCWSCPKHCKNSKNRSIRLRRTKTLQDFNTPGFHRIETTDTKDSKVSERLCQLANDESITQIFEHPRYQLVIDALYELPPITQYSDGKIVMGVNSVQTMHYGTSGSIAQSSSKSWKIGILMKKYGCYISHDDMVDTLLHELAHCYHENHSAAFHAEWDKLRGLYQSYTWQRRRKAIQQQWKNLKKEMKRWLPLIIPVIMGGVIILGKVLIDRKKSSKKIGSSEKFLSKIRFIPKMF